MVKKLAALFLNTTDLKQQQTHTLYKNYLPTGDNATTNAANLKIIPFWKTTITSKSQENNKIIVLPPDPQSCHTPRTMPLYDLSGSCISMQMLQAELLHVAVHTATGRLEVLLEFLPIKL